jgi:hypothetical protein
MATLSIRIPDSLHQRIKALAARDHVSLNQFVSISVAEKAATIMTVDDLVARGKCASRNAYETVLSKVGGSEIVPGDELPER